MPSEPSKRRRDRIIEWIGNPLEWSEVDKSLLVAGGTFPFCLAVALFNAQVLRAPALAPFFDRGFLERHLLPAWLLVAWWGLLCLAGIALRKKAPTSRWYLHLVIQSWLLEVSLLGYFIGPLTTPIGVTILVNAMVGYLLFDIRSVSLGFTSALALLIGTGIAAQLGAIPYAPLIAAPPFEVGRLAPWWFHNTGAPFLLQILGFLALYIYVLGRWRDREAKLAFAYADLSRAKDQLVRAESLAAVGSLVTGAAHELRNPLGSSSGLLQSLLEDLQSSQTLAPEEKAEALGILVRSLEGQQRAATIAERLDSLSDSLAHVGAMRPLSAVLEALGSRYPRVEFQQAPPAAALPVNDRTLTTILSNLLDNALAAGGEETPTLAVHLSINGEEAEGRGWIEFTVSDTGRGIPKAQQSEVFKPFFTGEKTGAGHGVGLGLYIVYELASRMGGQVSLESEEGKGTQVTVRLPAGGPAA